MMTLNQHATEDEWPRQVSLFNEDDLIVEVIMGEADPDSAGDLFLTPFDKFKAEFEADVAWMADTVAKMAEVSYEL